MELKIIYEDNHLISVVKQQGVPVQKDASGDEDLQTGIKRYLKEKYSKPGNVFLGIVHRLDRPVGGVMIFAKTSKAASRLSEQIRKGEWEKRYLAVVDGIPEEKTGVFQDFLIKDSEKNIVSVTDGNNPGSKKAVLSYRTILNGTGRSIVEIDLETGRSHQIRVQFASRGYPIVNDFKYNKSIDILRGEIALWAYSLKITHPVNGEKLKLSYEMPVEMAEIFF